MAQHLHAELTSTLPVAELHDTTTAAAIKAADPSAAVLGPSGWGYCEWIASGLDGLTVIVVNKTGDDLTSPLSVAGFDSAGSAQRFTYSPADLTSIVRGDDLAVSEGTVDATYPANSVTLLVLPKDDGQSAIASSSQSPDRLGAED